MTTFIIAEAGVNHNGELRLALELVDAAAKAGADAIKFQTFKSDALVVKNTKTVAYQSHSTGTSDQHSLLQRLELSTADHEKLFARARELNVEFMSTAFDSDSAKFLVKLGIRRVKVPSGEITNLPFLAQLAGYGLPVILSTGMADLDEVRLAVDTIKATQAALPTRPEPPSLTVLHCTSAYPTPDTDVNLLAMNTLAGALDLPIGYSDHTPGTFVAPVAVAMGASIIEKHVTLDRKLPGPDHAASIEPDELARMVADVRRIEALKGSGLKAAQPSELEARQLVRKGLKAARDLPAGHVLTPADVAVLRPAAGLPPSEFNRVVGARIKSALAAGAPLTWDVIA